MLILLYVIFTVVLFFCMLQLSIYLQLSGIMRKHAYRLKLSIYLQLSGIMRKHAYSFVD